MSVEIKYKGNTIASASTDTTKTIKTSGKYCEADIEVINTQDRGITPTGNINITDTNITDVTNYETAQVVSENLKPENIKKDIDILGIIGSFEGGGGGLVKIGTVTPNTTEGSYGQLEIPANDGVFLCTNCSITPNNTNRVPWAVACYVNTTLPKQSAAVLTYEYVGTGINASGSGQLGDIAYFKGASSVRFNTACTYDLYKLY